RDSSAVGAWIVGNEFAYFDLWEDISLYPRRRMLGYDSTSLGVYRDWLRDEYEGEISALNANWGTSYQDFEGVVMPQFYPEDRNEP
ncbi:MAG: hypothetical protein GWO24_11595, partial [Akkermansiaceae bacterium]|nr:hypothetical protein [Akkermansiaceae bacterium]